MKQQHININRSIYTAQAGDQEVHALNISIDSVDKSVIDNVHKRLIEMLMPLLAVTNEPKCIVNDESSR